MDAKTEYIVEFKPNPDGGWMRTVHINGAVTAEEIVDRFHSVCWPARVVIRKTGEEFA